ncbi:MAG: hypothetical protein EBS47_06170 [Betaproteobacteria bacterium]|nr:hypothetical protein [Betaproteobacteria bacterium]
MMGASIGARLSVAALHVLAFFAATAWGFGIGHEVAGAWLGMLMGLNAGVCAVLLLSGIQQGFRRWSRWPD